MTNSLNLECQRRELTELSPPQLRNQGIVPGVLYGQGFINLTLNFDRSELTGAFRKHGIRGLYSLKIKGERNPVLALVREVQKKPITREILHVDFMRVNVAERMTASVPVVLVGEEELIKQGGIIQTAVKEIEVECLPSDLPDKFTVDIAYKQIGDKVTVGDLPVPDGVEILADRDTVVVVVLSPSKEIPLEPEAEGEAPGEEES